MYAALVEWNPNGGECDSTVCHVKFGASVNTLPSATRNGFTFLGWYTKTDGGEKVEEEYTITSDTVLHAHWKPNPSIVITPTSGTTFEDTLTITIECDDENAQIYYTLDGSEPTINSTPYRKFRVSGKTTVKAIAAVDGVVLSDVAVAHYALGTCTDPIISPANGSTFQHSNQTVSIDWTETDGTLRYTLDGSEPTAASAEYAGPFTISETTTVRAKVISDRFFDSNVASATLTREWLKGATPTIAANPTFTGSKAKVRISCATDGAAIHYTTDGSIPDGNSPVYAEPLYVTESCTVKAYAVLDDYTDSDVASASLERTWGLGDSLGVTDMVFSSGGDAAWVRDTSTFKEGTDSMRSGSIGNGQTSELSSTVKGKGTFSFWWKTSCEDSDGIYDWDHAEFHADSQVYYLDGETGWVQVTHEFTTSGDHVLRWIYWKDDAGKDGSDCVWIDALEWAGDPIPDLGDEPVADEVEDAIYGSADGRLSRHITDGTKYKAYRQWANRVCGSDFTKRQAVKDSAHAWLSFALDTDALLMSVPTQGDLTIVGFKPSATSGTFDFEISVEDIDVGGGAAAINLAEIFSIEGAEAPEGPYSPDAVTVSFGTPASGKVRCAAGPKDASAQSFFMRVKMAP